MEKTKTLSVVVSVYNEEAALEEFYKTAEPVFADLPWDYELVFVNDGSADGSDRILRQFSARNPKVRVIEFSRNFGHEAAMIAGIDYSRGDGIVWIQGMLLPGGEIRHHQKLLAILRLEIIAKLRIEP